MHHDDFDNLYGAGFEHRWWWQLNAVKAWITTICITSVVCTIIEILFPKGNMEKIFRVVLGIFMLSAVVVPLKNSLSRINFSAKMPEISVKEKSKLKETINDQSKSIVQKNLKATIKEILKAKSVKPEKINIIMDTSKDNCISIKNVEVFLARGDKLKKDAVKNELEKRLELKVDVVVGSE